MTLDELKTRCLNCTECELCKARTQVVFGVGNPAAILRNPNNKEAAFGDWLKVRDKIEELHLNV